MAKLAKVSLLPVQQKSEAVGMEEKPAKENPGNKAKGWCGIPFCMLLMFYYHWVIKKFLWPVAGQNIARWGNSSEFRRMKEESGT